MMPATESADARGAVRARDRRRNPVKIVSDARRSAKRPAATGAAIRCREIEPADLDAVADLLTRGFTGRPRRYWMDGLRRQSEREVPEGFPRFGYMIDHGGTPVGALLLLYAARRRDGGAEIRCNVSSWYVDPAFRNYAPMLAKIAQRHCDVTYFNVSPARWTWETIEAQGFRTYCRGLFFSFPALSFREKGMRIETIGPDAGRISGLSGTESALLARHASYGCLSLVCRTADGRVFPFVLQSMRVDRVPLPAMQMIHCRDIAEYVASAGAIGRFLLARGRISVAIGANGPVKDLWGVYREPLGRKYYKGPQSPGLADLSDTELVIYGP
jgi:hypothetical protein